jgi:hypothetical protein
LCSDKVNISENVCFEGMELGMLDRFCPSLKTRERIEEKRCEMNRNSERYVIAMHIKNVWTNTWLQDPRKKFFQVQHCDPRA